MSSSMPSMEVLIYEATRQIFDDRFPQDIQPISEHTQLEFDPIPNSNEAWGAGHCYTLVRGGEKPSYRIFVPAGELWIKLFESGKAKRFMRTPDQKAVDGVVLHCEAQYRYRGVHFLPLEGGKPIVELADELESVNPEPSKIEPQAAPRTMVVDWGSPPTGPAPKRTQLSFFDLEEVA